MASVQTLLAQIAANTAKQRAAAAYAGAAAGPYANVKQQAAAQSQAASQSMAQSQAMSSEFAMVAAAINIVKDAIKKLISQADELKQAVMSSVEAYKPFQVYLFTRRLMDLQAVFGVMFLPVLLKFKQALRDVADYFYNLPQGFRKVVEAVAGLGVAISVIASIAAVVTAATAAIVLFLALGPTQIIAEFTALVYWFSQTAGGANFFRKALSFIEDAFADIADIADIVWEAIKPVRDLVSAAFDALGDALSDFMEAMGPLMDMLIVIGGGVLGAIAYVLGAIISLVTFILKLLFNIVMVGPRIISWLAKLLGFGMENLQKTNNTAFGLAAQGGSITGDVAGMKTKIEEIILANTGRESDDPAKQTAKNTEQIAKDVAEIKDGMGSKPTSSGRPSTIWNPAGENLAEDVSEWIKKKFWGP